ncbi:multimeric flavodoxin [Methanobrevibacter sp. 87.7]|uniref:flavodoxin family protein n=1 Tax=Methanobrevibacter sp. 87.7 TaxID=387957 RepID=UPI000B514234|nr:flavodoxin family protein [Methanobrevibacter sp. 87.7]OWT33804.1 multimeric flavodoxin [Methanobrevibacter sp. 87.7]
MKILGINTSPRQDSNVKAAMEVALSTAQEEGADTIIISTNKLDISPCQADNYCKEHDGHCAIQDNMQAIYKKIEDSDVIVLGTPIYFSDISAQAKLIIDRLYSYFMNEDYQKLFSNKKVYFITTNGVAPAESFKPSLETQINAFVLLGFQKGDILSLGGNNEPGAFKDKDDQIEKAKEFGKKLVN